jgi:heterotetrameric sarcosine oxidase gamma subunit
MEDVSVADRIWDARSPLGTIKTGERHGVETDSPGLWLSDIGAFDLALVMTRKGKHEETARACATRFGASSPAAGRLDRTHDALLVSSGPDQFLALRPMTSASSGIALRDAFAGTASVSDQSHGRCLIGITGPNARDALAKLCSLDLDNSAFPARSAAATMVDYTSVNLWRLDDENGVARFCMLVPASFAQSLWHGLIEAGAEYGVELRQTAFTL